jgi:restriction system protein
MEVILFFALIIIAFLVLEKLRLRSIMRRVRFLVRTHETALTRKRFQTLRRDDYGNIVRDKWNKEINYFIKTVFRPMLSNSQQRVLNTHYSAVVAQVEAQVFRAWMREGNRSKAVTSPVQYEHLCASELRKGGWSVQLTKASGDQGADVIAEKSGMRIVLQCKWYTHPVGNKAVQEAAAARAHERAQVAAVVSNMRYTPAAQQLAITNGILLLHQDDLRGLHRRLVSPEVRPV